ncbi:hypothetical protein HanIR_Chr09g0408071 [Helianthus annuus]|nr:hypothetical protein HanIR_Chr09g0408071 [Helianthus annuus]
MLWAFAVNEGNLDAVKPFQHSSHPITARESLRVARDKVFVAELSRLHLLCLTVGRGGRSV